MSVQHLAAWCWVRLNETKSLTHLNLIQRALCKSHLRGKKLPCSVESKGSTRTRRSKAFFILSEIFLCLSSPSDFCSLTWQFCITQLSSCKGPTAFHNSKQDVLKNARKKLHPKILDVRHSWCYRSFIIVVLHRGCIVNLFSHQLRSKFQMSVSVKKQSIYVRRVSFCAATRAFDIVYLKLYSLKELSPCGSALNEDKRSIITPDAPRILIK